MLFWACEEKSKFNAPISPHTQVEDGSFEAQRVGVIQEPFVTRPVEGKENFVITIDPSAGHGTKYLNFKAEKGEWWGISQRLQLKPNKKYTTFFLVRGDSVEMHCGAFGAGRFLGWNNANIPKDDWQRVQYDFYTDSVDANTNVYIAVKHPSKSVQVQIDKLEVVQELPLKE